MKVGIVGSEKAKFTPQTMQVARRVIRKLLETADGVVSGHCHLGGIDIWAVEEERALELEVTEFPPTELSWSKGYRPRNLQIAQTADAIACITVARLPDGYVGMRFPAGCYHCGTPPEHHVKSGGCWTVMQAHLMGKPAKLVVIDEDAPHRVRIYRAAELPKAHKLSVAVRTLQTSLTG